MTLMTMPLGSLISSREPRPQARRLIVSGDAEIFFRQANRNEAGARTVSCDRRRQKLAPPGEQQVRRHTVGTGHLRTPSDQAAPTPPQAVASLHGSSAAGALPA